MQVEQVRGVASEQVCNIVATHFNQEHTLGHAYCLPEGRQVSVEDLLQRMGGPEK
jgi:hypothetical protein